VYSTQSCNQADKVYRGTIVRRIISVVVILSAFIISEASAQEMKERVSTKNGIHSIVLVKTGPKVFTEIVITPSGKEVVRVLGGPKKIPFTLTIDVVVVDGKEFLITSQEILEVMPDSALKIVYKVSPPPSLEAMLVRKIAYAQLGHPGSRLPDDLIFYEMYGGMSMVLVYNPKLGLWKEVVLHIRAGVLVRATKVRVSDEGLLICFESKGLRFPYRAYHFNRRSGVFEEVSKEVAFIYSFQEEVIGASIALMLFILIAIFLWWRSRRHAPPPPED